MMTQRHSQNVCTHKLIGGRDPPQIKRKLMKKILVQNAQFYKVDEDGNTVRNDDGSVKMFTIHQNVDVSFISEYFDEHELTEVKEGSF